MGTVHDVGKYVHEYSTVVVLKRMSAASCERFHDVVYVHKYVHYVLTYEYLSPDVI